ncbi:hypothetical protein EJ08DRAFT_495286 [Tothia fuscella]|uniref:Cep57 centrosome microtubule-binding domain-containing protein n=1 Tax=Tothia fuscella TaxID=1048955 RepID=A0A9P4U2N0_9PEZI|nr:hypothetical protein EJ08DRAFT_495286 [Tothia fuscella]
MSDSGRSSNSHNTNGMATSRRALNIASPSNINQQSSSEPTFDLSHDAIMSTRQDVFDDAQDLPKIRATAQKMNMGYYNPPMPAVDPRSSAVARHFQDFDSENAQSSSSSSPSVEIGRGRPSRLRQTPSKSEGLPSELLLSMGNTSYYEVNATPPRRPRPTTTGSLRKEAALRRTSAKYTNANPNDSDGSTAAGARGQRFGKSTRNAASIIDSPRNTIQSFALPDIPNLTEMIDGNYKDGTPIFSAKSRSRFTSGTYRVPTQPNFVPVGGIAIPQEEKAILASLELLKDKIAHLEHDKAQSDRKIEDYENEIIDLRASVHAQANFRRSDSALGSTDGEGGSKEHTLRQEKIRSVKSLQDRLNRAEKKISTAESATKRITKERDAVVEQLGVAFLNSEELKNEVDGLQNENKILQDQVTDLQSENRELTAENEVLRAQLDEAHGRHDEDTQKWTKKEAVLNRKAGTADRVILEENQTLRHELLQMRQQQEEEARQAAQKEAAAVRKAEKAARAEHDRLAAENEQLQMELEQAKALRVDELKRWKSKQAALQARVDDKEETVHLMKAATPHDEANEQMRQQNEDLKSQLAQLKARPNVEDAGTSKVELRRKIDDATQQREQETQRWEKKEALLRQRLDQAREVNTLNRQLNDLRDDTRGGASRVPDNSRSKRKSTGQINIHNNVSAQLDQEMQKNRATSAAQPFTTSRKLRSPSKSQTRNQLPRNYRHSSAPIVHDGNASDESTTNLSFDQAITGTRRSQYQAFEPATFHTGDTTFLTFIPDDEIARLRKRVEEEHHAAKLRQTGTAATVGERYEANSTRNLTQKSALKDHTGRSEASNAAGLGDVNINASSESEEEHQHTKQDTVCSNLSIAESRSNLRRRTGLFAEMTSAFIVPDITLQSRGNANGHKIISSPHDTTACTVCARIVGSALPDKAIPTLVPVSTRPEVENNPDATMRPTQGPIPALSRVMKELHDELIHLRLELHGIEQKLISHDPALGKRARKSLHEKLVVLNQAIDSKSDQIYALNDVVECHKDELVDGVVGEEIERTMESIRYGGKRVAFGGRKARVDEEEEEEDSDEAPWAGISDTESLHRR